MRGMTTYQVSRSETIENAAGIVFAGEDGKGEFDEAAVEVAEYLVDLAASVVQWARTAGQHGGNPYTLEMVLLAQGLGDYAEGDKR